MVKVDLFIFYVNLGCQYISGTHFSKGMMLYLSSAPLIFSGFPLNFIKMVKIQHLLLCHTPDDMYKTS